MGLRGLGFRVSGSGFGGLGFRRKGLGFSLGYMIYLYGLPGPQRTYLVWGSLLQRSLYKSLKR